MKRRVIIFDGENTHEIGASYFFQHPKIKDLNKEQAKLLYMATASFEYTLAKGHTDNPELVNVEYRDPEVLVKVRGGLSILEQMVRDMYGDLIGTAIIIKTKKLINEV